MDASQLSSLFRPIVPGKTPKRVADEFDFIIDRGRRQVLGTFNPLRLDPTGSRETIRVQTNRHFECSCRVELRDTSLGETRLIPCELRFSGSIRPTEEAARACLEAALREDQKFGPAIERLIAEAGEAQRKALGGDFLPAMQNDSRRAAVEAAFAGTLAAAGIPVERARLAPIMRDDRRQFNVEEKAGIEVRAQTSLERHSLGFKASLVWGKDNEHKLARLAYAGSTDADGPRRPLERPLVSGQTQPLGAWLRDLIAQEVGEHAWEAILRGERPTIDAVREKVSKPLGRGTGRIVEALVLVPLVGPDPVSTRQLSFSSKYKINGLRPDGLEIEHDVSFELKDRDRWTAQNSPDPEPFLKVRIEEAMRLFLQPLRYEDVVTLYLNPAQGEAKIVAAIQNHVEPLAATIGFRLMSIATVLGIPEMPFVAGRKLTLPDHAYSLAEGHIAAPMEVAIEVKVGPLEQDGAAFSRATLAGDSIEQQVLLATREELQTILRGHKAFEYYTSKFANGSDLPQSPFGAFAVAVEERLREKLRARFGLCLNGVDLRPTNDPYVRRLSELMSLTVDCEIDETFNRGGPDTQVRVGGFATIYVESIDPDHWEAFYPQVTRTTLTEHKAEISKRLFNAIRRLEGLIAHAKFGELNRTAARGQIEDHVRQAIRDDCGLVTRVTMHLTIQRPAPGMIAQEEVLALQQQLRQIWAMRPELFRRSVLEPNFFGDDLNRLDSEEARVKARLKEAAESQAIDIERTEVVLIGRQDPAAPDRRPRARRLASKPPVEPPPS
jgi:hypothetical protein